MALGYILTDLLPVGVVGERHHDAITVGSRGEEAAAVGFLAATARTVAAVRLRFGPALAMSSTARNGSLTTVARGQRGGRPDVPV